MKSILMLAFMLSVVSTAHAESFYPACLKPDGDWVHGLTRKECVGKELRGHWYTAKVLKRARRVM